MSLKVNLQMQLLQQLCVGERVSVYQLITSPCNSIIRHCLACIGRLIQKEKCDLYPREAKSGTEEIE